MQDGIIAGGKGRLSRESSRENVSKGLGRSECRATLLRFFFFFPYTGKERKHSSGGSWIKNWCLVRWEEVQHVLYNERKEEKENERRGLTQERNEGQ